MKNLYNAGLIGCGDYLRWEIDKINQSKKFNVKYTYDVNEEKSTAIAQKIGASTVPDADQIFNDPEIDIVLIYTPPWIRKEYFKKAADSGKHIITTKPLASNLNDAKELLSMVEGKIQCAVFYGRTGNAGVEKLKEILDSGEIGELGIYKEDWFHHYPQWNDWATDPEKNGGPFMDAMVHNLNKSLYLIDDKVKNVSYFSQNHAQTLKCNDTEGMKIDFQNGSASYLFITWAADLEVFSLDGNEREHIGILHMITNKAWYVTEEEVNGKIKIRAKKENNIKEWDVEELTVTPYDEFAMEIEKGETPKFDITLALRDIEILDKGITEMSE